MGKAYLIGTGPGDEDLLTVKAVRILEKCTAVLYDRLGSNNILNYLNEDCEVYYCGKEPGAHYKTQDQINNMLVKLVKEGHTVGRVKGGDPYVFGRGGEEVLALKEEGLDFEVVPGITSPIAVLNYAGIPVSHRNVSQSIHIVTGMTSVNEKINWEALSKENGTLIFLMGVENIGRITENLISNGKNKNTPAAVVMRGTTSKQRKVVGTLQNICDRVVENGITSPAIIVVGDVVNLNENLNWYENKPLFGNNICITRSKEQSSNLKVRLKELGADITEINSIKIEKTPENLEQYLDIIGKYDHILFTSVNGVNIFFDYLIEQGIDFREIKGKISVVGSATKRALQNRGIVPFASAKEFVAEGLFDEIKPYLKEGENVLLPVSSKGRSYLQEQLTNYGLNVDKIHVYNNLCGKLRDNRSFEDVDYILFTSPSTVENMILMVGKDKIKSKRVIAIGPRTAKALLKENITCHICKKHSEDGFLDEIGEIINGYNEQ